MPSNQPNHQPPQETIIIGGGPVGLATALLLSKTPHNQNICVFEPDDTSRYNVHKAYFYNINPRGQELTRKLPSVHKKIEELGVKFSFTDGFMMVPADPKKALPKAKTVSTGIAPKKKRQEQETYWIPRHEVMKILVDAVAEHNDTKSEEEGKIRICWGKECVEVQPEEDGSVLVVVKDVSTGAISSQWTQFVIGADGRNSTVRKSLSTEFSSWGDGSDKFTLRQWVSPSTGLRLKALQLPPNFQIPDNNGTSIQTKPETIYVLESVNTGTRNYIRLSLFPSKFPNAIRPAIFATRPNHEIWSLREGSQARRWFQKSFPRFSFDVVTEREWDRFAKEEGVTFPPCQYSPGMQLSRGKCGAVLVGDAVHAFPPDCGQGINSGFGDAVELESALRLLLPGELNVDKMQRCTLSDVLSIYEKRRGPEIKALIRLARFGSPYQYNQPLIKDRICRFLWKINVVTRLLLHKISFGLVPTSCIMLMQDYKLTYYQVMRRADFVTFGLCTGILLLFVFMCLWFSSDILAVVQDNTEL